MTKEGTKSKILIIDDMSENIRMLIEILKDEFATIPAKDGATGLQKAEELNPAVILLDIMMPEMDGYEVCKRLKANENTRDIPVIFITAISEAMDGAKAFTLGAVDFVEKPFNPVTVKARVRTHARLQNAILELKRLNRDKNEFLGITVHDLKSPLAGVQGIADLIIDDKRTDPEICSLATHISDSVKTMLDLIHNLLDISAIDDSVAPGLEQFDFRDSIHKTIQSFSYLAKAKDITLAATLPEEPVTVIACEKWMVEVVGNLVSNAIKFSPQGTSVDLELATNQDSALLTIKDRGPGFTETDMKQIFGRFTRLSAKPTGKESSTGLGLYIVKKLTELMNGKVWCENQPDQGACFYVEVKIKD